MERPAYSHCEVCEAVADSFAETTERRDLSTFPAHCEAAFRERLRVETDASMLALVGSRRSLVSAVGSVVGPAQYSRQTLWMQAYRRALQAQTLTRLRATSPALLDRVLRHGEIVLDAAHLAGLERLDGNRWAELTRDLLPRRPQATGVRPVSHVKMIEARRRGFALALSAVLHEAATQPPVHA